MSKTDCPTHLVLLLSRRMEILYQSYCIVAYFVIIQLCGIIMLPAWSRLLRALPDHGYSTSKVAGLLVLSFLSWIGTALGFPTHSFWGLWTILIAMLLFVLLTRWQSPGTATDPFPSWKYVLFTELIFTGAYVVWICIRVCSPAISHTEQPMDYMLLNAVMTSTSYPVQDLWLFNFPVSYYYFGYWMQSVPALVTHCPPALTYNIAQASWFALICVLCFSIGSNLAALFYTRKASPILGGIITICAIVLISNLQGLTDAVTTNSEHWWWWSASRTLHDGDIELITEFPAFSLLLGDNHPHLLNLPALLLMITLALALFCTYKKTISSSPGHRRMLLLTALLLTPVIFMTNSWDWPTVSLLLLLVIQFASFNTRQTLIIQLMAGVSICLLTLLLALPYHLTAQSQVSGIAFLHGHLTRPWEWFSMFGLFTPGILLGLALLISDMFRRKPIPIPASFMTILLITGLVCSLIPELCYIKDVFANRMNTVFKFYYQSWIYLGLASACGIIYGLSKSKGYIVAVPALLVLLSGLVYTARASLSITNRFTPSPFGINGVADALSSQHDLSDALQWISDQTPRDALIVTAPGRGYAPLSAPVSTYAARPALLGWVGHEQQWRGRDYHSMTASRMNYLNKCYITGPAEDVLHHPLWLETDYLYVGDEERRFMGKQQAFFESMQQYISLVFSNKQIRIYEKK